MRTGVRRGGAVFSAITGLIFYGFWTLLASGAASFFADPANAASFLPALSSGLMFVALYWQLAPVISAGFGASLDLRKLLVYPIPRGKLFTVEVLLRLTSCAEMLIVLAGGVTGLLRNPLYSAKASVFILGGALLFTATNILCSTGARYLIERLFLRSRLKEAMLFLLVVVGIAPQIFLFLDVRKSALLRFAPSQILWPWAAIARLMLRQPMLLSAGVSLLYLGAAWLFGRWQFERSIHYDGSALPRSGKSSHNWGISEAFLLLPSRMLPDPLAALVEKELRTLTRISRVRMAYAMSCIFGIVLFLPLLRDPRPDLFFFQNALPLMALYGLMMMGPITYWNAFGFDRSAAQGYFCWPIRFRDALIAKNIAVTFLLLPQMVAISLVGKIARLPWSAAKFLETIVVVLIASLYWFSVGNVCSVRMPRAMDPAKMNQMANRVQALTIWTAPLLLFPLALAYWGRAVFKSELVFSGILLIAAIIGGIVYKVGLDSAASTATERREAILQQLAQSDGPVSVS